MGDKRYKLTVKQERFCHEYLKDFNAAAAYIRAGYSPKGAQQNAYKLLTFYYIQEKNRRAECALPPENWSRWNVSLGPVFGVRTIGLISDSSNWIRFKSHDKTSSLFSNSYPSQ